MIRFDILKLFLLLIIVCFKAYSQKEYHNWYFGENAAITFNSGTPVILNDSKTTYKEASASISDNNGNLLFYSQGLVVYNKDHQIMMNGSDLLGHWSSSQIQIVQQPGNDSIYYLFTVDGAENHLVNGLRYSVINMNHDNGRGGVIEKNISMLVPATEKIAVARHANGIDFWIVVHSWGDNKYYSYLLDSNGLNTQAVISPIGIIHVGGDAGSPEAKNYTNSVGYLKFSPSFNKLAAAIHWVGTIQLFEFNRLTGEITALLSTATGYDNVYGLEFSENENFLYCSRIYTGYLYQFNIQNNNLQNVTLISNQGSDLINSLQLAPDGKIYIGQYGSHYLGVIQNPDSSGTLCNYVPNAIFLGNGLSYRGLPLYLAPPGIQVDFKIGDDCYSESQSFSIINPVEPDSVLWNFGDPASGNDNTSTDTLGVHHFPSPGIYEVELTVYASGIQGKTKKKINLLSFPQVDLGNDTVLCEGEQISFDVSASAGTYKWSDGSTSPVKTITQPGDYSVEITNSCGTVSDTIGIEYSIIPDLLYSGDTTVCLGEEVVISALEKSGISYNWSTGDHTSSISVTPLTGAEIGLHVENEYGCIADYYLNLNTINCYYEIEIPNVFTPNQDNINDFWIIKNIDYYPKAEVYIYTRWGKEIFKSKGYETPWDGIYNGKILPSGNYYYIIILNNGTPAHTGNVSIYR